MATLTDFGWNLRPFSKNYIANYFHKYSNKFEV